MGSFHMTCHATSLSISGSRSGQGIFSSSLRPPSMLGMPPCMQNICQGRRQTLTPTSRNIQTVHDIFSIKNRVLVFIYLSISITTGASSSSAYLLVNHSCKGHVVKGIINGFPNILSQSFPKFTETLAATQSKQSNAAAVQGGADKVFT